MSTKAYYPISEIGAGKPGFSRTRSIIEGAFYGNNVVKVNTLILEVQHPVIEKILFAFRDQQMSLCHELRIQSDIALCMIHRLPAFVASVYGLSGSGKSTLTHAKHDGKYEIKVLHDDAFIINTDTCASVALEPTYFDKTADYPTGCADNQYLLTVCPERIRIRHNAECVHVGARCHTLCGGSLGSQCEPVQDLSSGK